MRARGSARVLGLARVLDLARVQGLVRVLELWMTQAWGRAQGSFVLVLVFVLALDLEEQVLGAGAAV